MSQTEIIVRLSVLMALVVAAAVTAMLSAIVRGSGSVSHRQATRDRVQFVVSTRRWQRVGVRVMGIILIPLGLIFLLGGTIGEQDSSTSGMGWVGAGLTILAIWMVWFAHALFRMRLEVLADTVWVFPLFGKPREVRVGSIASLEPLTSSTVGGIVARAPTGEKLFDANKSMLGYPQLIGFLMSRRPDLAIPDVSWPIQGMPPR